MLKVAMPKTTLSEFGAAIERVSHWLKVIEDSRVQRLYCTVTYGNQRVEYEVPTDVKFTRDGTQQFMRLAFKHLNALTEKQRKIDAVTVKLKS